MRAAKVNERSSEEARTTLVSLEEYVNAHVPEPFRYWLLHQRGYADRFDWPGPDRELAKCEKEQSIVEEWAAAVYRGDCPYVSIQPCAPPLPDCQLIDKGGNKIGVEVTELVDQATIEANRYTSYHWKEYSAGELFSAVANRLTAKNQKFQAARGTISQAGFSKVVEILHSDEPDLRSRPAVCREVCSGRNFPLLSEIDEAFLLLPCPRKKNLHDFEAEFCQPIRILLPARK